MNGSSPKAPCLTLAVFIDALGWEIGTRHDFLPDLLLYRRPMNTVFGYSSTCDPTILTGAAPDEHGHFAFYTYDPARSPFRGFRWLRFLPGKIAERGRVRRQISKIVQWQLGYTGYFQLYNVPFHLLPQLDYTERRDLYEPGGIINGNTTIFDDLRTNSVPFHVSDWRKGERENLDDAAEAINSGNLEFAYVFLAELDAILHACGTRSEKVAQKLRWYEEQVRNLCALASQRYERVTLALFSDHGMTDIHSEFDLARVVGQLPFRIGQDYFTVYDSTMARFWYLNPTAERAIRRELENVSCGHWLSEPELDDWGCLFPDRRYGHQFFLMNPGVLLNPSFMGTTRLSGMHGYSPTDKDSIAFFGTNSADLEIPLGLADLRSSLWRNIRPREHQGVCE